MANLWHLVMLIDTFMFSILRQSKKLDAILSTKQKSLVSILTKIHQNYSPQVLILQLELLISQPKVIKQSIDQMKKISLPQFLMIKIDSLLQATIAPSDSGQSEYDSN